MQSSLNININANEHNYCLRGIMQADIKIIIPARKFFSFVVRRPYLYPEVVPTDYRSVQVIEGRAGRAGYVIRSTFVDGSTGTSVQRVSTIDYKNKYAVWDEIEGQVLETCKYFKYNFYCFSKCEGSIARWNLEYEKKNQDDPEPTQLLTLP
ncbi:hypothetical protein ACFE04_029562 [Oxalis oulophora]